MFITRESPHGVFRYIRAFSLEIRFEEDNEVEQNNKFATFFAKVGGAIAKFFRAVWSGICVCAKAVGNFFKNIEWHKTVKPVVAYSVFGGLCVVVLILFLTICI